MGRSPRTWGWTESGASSRAWLRAFPTHVGMDRLQPDHPRKLQRVPHARGDGPSAQSSSLSPLWRSPRTWGWTVFTASLQYLRDAFPTHVGMDRPSGISSPAGLRVPHARGDGPHCRRFYIRACQRSPRTWGWTGKAEMTKTKRYAFPTHVGMDRSRLGHAMCPCRVPHARGDGPRHSAEARAGRPRVPHARGDGPPLVMELDAPYARSPRTWGWTQLSVRWGGTHERSPRTWGWTGSAPQTYTDMGAFPTHVGMDLQHERRPRGGDRVPHARGDGPGGFPVLSTQARRSPRTWGWTDA